MPECAKKCHRRDASSGGALRPRPLTPDQHAAARLLARGCGSIDAARQLGLNRHTIARWKRDPAFIAEVERLGKHLDDVAVATGLAAAVERARLDAFGEWVRARPAPPTPKPAPRPSPPSKRVIYNVNPDLEFAADEQVREDYVLSDAFMTDEELADLEDWVEQVIEAGERGLPIPQPPPERVERRREPPPPPEPK